MNDLRNQLYLYLVTDPDLCRVHGVVDTVQQAIAAGVTMVQLRDKGATTAERIVLARALKDVLRGTGVPLLVNDDVDAAIAADADGAHIGQGDIAVAEARARLGRQKLLGLSCETPLMVKNAEVGLVDYLGLGPVFGTLTKADHASPVGLEGLAQMAALTSMPTVAIGGLSADTHADVLAAGADGSAVVSAICGQQNIAAATRAFFAEVPA